RRVSEGTESNKGDRQDQGDDGQAGSVKRRLPPRSTERMDATGMNATELNRLRWRCRRGLLENDLILARYLDAQGSVMSAEDVAALDRLLDLADGELWDLIAGRAEPADPGLLHLVAALRSA